MFVPDDILRATGIPEIPRELAERASRYTEYRSAELLDWHPRRRQMIILTRFGDTPQIHEVAWPGGARRQLTFFPDHVSWARYCGEALIFAKDSGGSERYQLYRYDQATGGSVLLTDGRSRNTGALPSPSGRLLAYNSTRRNGADTDFYVMDPKDPRTDRLLARVAGGGWAVYAWSPDERTLLVNEAVSGTESYLWLLDARTGSLRPLTGRLPVDPTAPPRRPAEAARASYQAGAFAADGQGIYVTTDRGSEFQRLAYIDLRTGRHDFLASAIPWDVDSLDLSRDGRTLAFVTNQDGIGVLHLLDTRTRSTRQPRLPPGSVLSCRWHDNGRDLGLVLTRSNAPPDVFSLDARTGKVERWTESEAAARLADLPEPTQVHFRTFDGRELSAWYHRPPARFTGPRPVIIHIHGGPELQSRLEYLGNSNYYLEEMGIAILRPNVRGSSGYGKGFLRLDDGEQREGAVEDIGALLSWIQTQPGLDRDRVMITGRSYGGYMALAVAARYGDRIRCVMEAVGISSFVTFLEHTEAYRRDLRRAEYGDERDPQMRTFLLGISPLSNADRIRTPLFVVQGRNDPRVPYTEAEQIVATLQRRHTPVWYLLAGDEGHRFAKKANLDYQFYATLLFIERYLLV